MVFEKEYSRCLKLVVLMHRLYRFWNSVSTMYNIVLKKCEAFFPKWHSRLILWSSRMQRFITALLCTKCWKVQNLFEAVLRIRIRVPVPFWSLDPESGRGFSGSRIPDLGSLIPNPYFWELSDNFLKKYNSFWTGSNVSLYLFKNKIFYNFVKFVAAIKSWE